MKAIRQLLPLLVAMAALLTLFGLWVPNFLQPENMLDLIQQISVNAILAFGMTLVILIGGIDLSVGALLALVGTTTVYVLTRNPGEAQNALWLILAILAGLGVAGTFGAFNGLCAAKTPMPPFIITLSTMLVARGAALRFNEGRPMHIPDYEGLFLAIGNGRLLGLLPIPVVLMLIVFLVMTVLLHRTRFGQHLYAIGGNFEAAARAGIPVKRTLVKVYIMSAVLAGIAGVIWAARFTSGAYNAGETTTLNAIAAVVIGGASMFGGEGTIVGTIIGALIIGTIQYGLVLLGVSPFWQYVAIGFVVILAVVMDQFGRNLGK